MSKYIGKVVGNTILISAEPSTKVTTTSSSERVSHSPIAKDTRLSGEHQALDDNDNYDFSLWTVTAVADLKTETAL